MAGKRARKKVNESAAALVDIDPCHNPLKKKDATLYNDIPSKPGIIRCLENLLIKKTGQRNNNIICSIRLFINLLALTFVL